MTLTSVPRIKAVIISEADGQRSRENIVVTQTGTALASGTVLTKIDTGAATAAATAGNTGNPTFGAITAGVAAVPGAYKLTFTAATKFDVEDPDGIKIGTGTTGVAFSKSGLGFTLTAGGTAAVAGDEFTVTVAAGSGKYVAYTANGAAGQADAVLYNWLPALTGDAKAVAFVRHAELNRFELTGLDAAAQADLTRTGLIVRGAAGVPSISTPAL
ncbi:MAG: head decoration protein [Polaromonas sp.]